MWPKGTGGSWKIFFREQEENSNFINKQVEAYEEVFLCKCEGFGNGQE